MKKTTSSSKGRSTSGRARSPRPRPRSKSPVRAKSQQERRREMERMEAAAAGGAVAPSMKLDVAASSGSFESQISPPQLSPKQEEGFSFQSKAIVASEFLSALTTSSPTRPPPAVGQKSPSTGQTEQWQQRDNFAVDQSINLMDASNEQYSLSDHLSGKKQRKSRGHSFVDIFLGGKGATSGSFSPERSSQNKVQTSWKKSSLGRCLIASFLLGFLAIMAVSIGFFVSTGGDTLLRTPEMVNRVKNETARPTAPPLFKSDPLFDHAPVEVHRESVNFETNAAASGPATFADFDYDQTVQDTTRLEELQSQLLAHGATTRERLEDLTSPAFYALRWLTDDDLLQMDPNDHAALKTRFALATLFYATHVPQETSSAAAAATQRQTLDDNKDKAIPNHWTRENEWMTGSSVCEWYGVDCEKGQPGSDDQAAATVVHLNLTSNGLQGTIPRELSLLNQMVLLDLSSNDLEGPIPNLLVATLTKLKYLLLHKNSLSGTIPEELDQLVEAFEIYLSYNQLTGTLPVSWFHDPNNLRALYLGHNQLTGDIEPVVQLEGIGHLHLDHNALEGTLPSAMSQLTMLNDLRLDNNKLTGTLPSEMVANTRLKLLYLGNNKLLGEIPDMFADLHKLTDLQLHGNNFKSDLPSSMGSLTSLRRLTLEGNDMAGHLPSEWGRMTDLEALDLIHNYIVGTIPTEFGEMRNLREMELGHNFLEGPIPSELGQLTRLKNLGMQHSAIEGAVPSELGNLKTLVKLDLAETLVTGTVPEEICVLTEENNLKVFQTDCKSEIECSCCSQCS